MPVIIPENLPATRALQREYIPVMHERRALTQDIRPLKIALVNLMPKKIETEIQFLRLIGNTPLQVEVDLIAPATHESKNTSRQHLLDFYKTIDQIEGKRYDGCIVTGAPVEHMAFEEVDYWEELKRIMDFCLTDVFSTIFICWERRRLYITTTIFPKWICRKNSLGCFCISWCASAISPAVLTMCFMFRIRATR